MRLHLCAIGIAALTVAGCATFGSAPLPIRESYSPVSRDGQNVFLRYESQPAGAQVLRDGVVLGRTPFIHPEPVMWSSAEGRTVATCTSQEPVTFKWDSGASTTVQYPCQEFPVAMAARPADAPGLDEDLRVEKRVHSNLAYADYMSRRPRSGLWAFAAQVNYLPNFNDVSTWRSEPHRARMPISGLGPALIEAPRFQAPAQLER